MPNPDPPTAIKAAQALATCLALAGLMLEAAVARGILLVLSPDSRAVFEQTASGSATSAAYSIVLGYGIPIGVFGVLYALVALRLTRGRRWTWLLGLLLSVAGVVLCVTTVMKLLTFVGYALFGFQAVLALLLLAGARYFWSASPVSDGAAGTVAAVADASPSESEPAS